MFKHIRFVKHAFICLFLVAACDSGPDPSMGKRQSSHVSADACSAETEGQSCDDGNACTFGEVCESDVCGGGQVRDCSPLDSECAVAQCNPDSGSCEVAPAREGESCDDGKLCTVEDTCQEGVCGGQAKDCSEHDSDCTQGVCHPVSGQCGALAVNDAGACEDGDLCTEGDSCSRGFCSPGGAKDCSSVGDACNSASCDSETGACEAVPAVEGASCEDGDLCTVGEVCQSGACVLGVPKDCSAFESTCAQASCDVSDGSCVVQAVSEGSVCQDDNVCTAAGVCSSGSCSGAPIAPPHDECTPGSRLSPGCTLCVSMVCFQDAYCCDNQWDTLCVSQAELHCGFTCG